MVPTTHNITNGPSKLELMLALFDRKPACRTVTFCAYYLLSIQIEVVVTSIEAEDGSGESWNIAGSVRSATPSEGVRVLPYALERGKRVSIYFRTDKRSGHIRFV